VRRYIVALSRYTLHYKLAMAHLADWERIYGGAVQVDRIKTRVESATAFKYLARN